MAYVLDGGNGESNGFTTAIANFALQAMHESQGLVDYTRVVAPNQGNQYIVPNFAAITYQDYAPNAAPGTGQSGFGFGANANAAPAAYEQNPSMTSNTITATPAVAATAFDVFLAWTTSFELAATIGEELGGSYAEKVDQRVAGAFLDFKKTPDNTPLVTADGFGAVSALGAMELAASGSNAAANTAATFSSNTVLGLVRNVKQNYTVARLPGTPVVVLDSNGNDGVVGSSMIRALSELTGGAVGSADKGGSAITSLGEELLATGQLSNLYGARVIFSNFLQDIPSSADANVVRTIDGANANVKVGAYFHETAIFTVLKEGLQVKMGEKPGGLQMWVTGLAYMGSGVADLRRGGAINIEQA